MEITNLKIKSIIDKRMRRDSELFFIELCLVGFDFGYSIVKRKKFQGLTSNGNVLIAPIYDEVRCLSNNVVALKLDNRYAMYNIDKKVFVSQFEYITLIREESFWKLIKESNEVSLYDSEKDQFLVSLGYTEYGIRQRTSQYFWAKRGLFFDYVKRESFQIISLRGVIMAYDTPYGMFGKDEHGKISYFEESGIENKFKMRHIVSEAGGYLVLNNFTYKIEDVIDVYGNILNI